MKEKYFYREIPSISIVALIFMICIYSFWMVKTVDIMRSNSVLSATIVFYISFVILKNTI